MKLQTGKTFACFWLFTTPPCFKQGVGALVEHVSVWEKKNIFFLRQLGIVHKLRSRLRYDYGKGGYPLPPPPRNEKTFSIFKTIIPHNDVEWGGGLWKTIANGGIFLSSTFFNPPQAYFQREVFWNKFSL